MKTSEFHPYIIAEIPINPEVKMELYEQETYVFLCQPNIDGMLTGIYDAWEMSAGTKGQKGCGHNSVRLQLAGTYNYTFFCKYIEVAPDADKALKVSRSICSKVSNEVYEHCIRALYSQADDRADAVYRFLTLAFRVGPRIMERYGDPYVMRVFELRRYVSEEAHQLFGFTRFEEYPNHVLAAKISPKNDVIELLASHFADRMSGEKWLIYDINRKRYALFRPETGLIFGEGFLEFLQNKSAQDEYTDLWKAFFDSVTIAERKNPRCQRTHLALRYRPNMTEFQ